MADHSHAIENARAKYETISELIRTLQEAADLDRGTTYDDTLQEIHELPLSVDVRSGWTSTHANRLKAEEYQILLTTGGPACRITGYLYANGEPVDAQLEWQDWGTPWTPCANLPSNAKNILLHFAEILVG